MTTNERRHAERRGVPDADGGPVDAYADGAAGKGRRLSQQQARLRDLDMKSAGYLLTGVDLKNPDFAKMAAVVGILGIRIENPADLEQAISQALAHRGPALLDVMTSPAELAMPPKTTFEEAYGFGLFMLKAVLSGRGSEIVELAKTNPFR